MELAVVLIVLLLAGRLAMEPKKLKSPQAPVIMDEDVDTARKSALIARTLWAETRGARRHTDAELEGIAQVALNRATPSRPLEKVLTPPGKSTCCGAWNTSDRFAGWWRESHTKPGFERCRGIALRVLAGETANRIGGRNMFFHPGGLRTCRPETFDPDENPKYVCAHFQPEGWRRAPKWSTHAPLRIGHAVFTFSKST